MNSESQVKRNINNMFLISTLLLFTIHQIDAEVNGPQVINADVGQNTGNSGLEINSRILGGSAVNVNNFPYQISLYADEAFICGGSIISEEWVLTAAHCLESPRKKYTVRAGSSYIYSGGTTHRVIDYKRHEEYIYQANYIDNDIAVMKVSPAFQFNENCWPIELLPPSETIRLNEISVVSGFGDTSEGGKPSKKLLVVDVPILSLDSCKYTYQNFKVTDSFICAGYVKRANKGSCQGDSGGPLTIYRYNKPKLAGVVSWGLGCELAGFYTRVQKYYYWITQNIGNRIGQPTGQQNYQGPEMNPVNVAQTNGSQEVHQGNYWAGQINGAQGVHQLNNLAGQSVGQQNYQRPVTTLLIISEPNRPSGFVPGRPVKNLINFIGSHFRIHG